MKISVCTSKVGGLFPVFVYIVRRGGGGLEPPEPPSSTAYFGYTVKPLIKDTMKEDKLLNKGQTQCTIAFKLCTK